AGTRSPRTRSPGRSSSMPELAGEAFGPQGDASRHRALAELEAGLRALAAAPTEAGRLALIVLRRSDGPRQLPERARLSIEEGLPGDGWGRPPPPHSEAPLRGRR